MSHYYATFKENPCVGTYASTPFNIQIKHGFSCINVSQVPLDWDLKNRELQIVWLQKESWSINHTRMSSWCLLSCLLLCQKKCQYWSGQGWQCQNTSRQNLQTLPKQWCVHWQATAIIRHVYSWTCVGHFWTEGSTRNADYKKSQALNGTLQELIPRHQITRIIQTTRSQ